VVTLAGVFASGEQKESTKVRNKTQQMQQTDAYTVDIQTDGKPICKLEPKEK
jgi:hypothetical protein